MCFLFCHLPILLTEPHGNCNINQENQGCKKRHQILIACKETTQVKLDAKVNSVI